LHFFPNDNYQVKNIQNEKKHGGFNPTINAKISPNYVVFTFIKEAKGKYILTSLKD
jgi:hypothetical protein